MNNICCHITEQIMAFSSTKCEDFLMRPFNPPFYLFLKYYYTQVLLKIIIIIMSEGSITLREESEALRVKISWGQSNRI